VCRRGGRDDHRIEAGLFEGHLERIELAFNAKFSCGLFAHLHHGVDYGSNARASNVPGDGASVVFGYSPGTDHADSNCFLH
jgi:hypothetical protein